MLVGFGELSSVRQALQAADLAPCTENARRLLTDRNKRPPELLDPIPVEVANHVPPVPFALDEDRFFKNMRVAKRGAAGGPSGMTAEHLRLLMDSPRDMKLFFKLAERLARGEVSDVIIQTIRMGRMTALRKAGGGVRGIVAGDIVRRLVARTMAQQLGPSVEAATSPFQYALSTRAGGECVAHALQGICEVNPNTTILSIEPGSLSFVFSCRRQVRMRLTLLYL